MTDLAVVLLAFDAGLVAGVWYAARRYHASDERDAMSLEFTTAKKRTEPIHFKLDGEEFDFTPHKSAGIVLALADGDYEQVMRRTLDWLGDGLPEDQAKRILDRIRDDDDDFDIDDLQKIIGRLQEQISGRPTTSPNGSSRRRTPTGRK